MADASATILADRAILALEGPDRVAFLQGLITQDAAAVSPGRAAYGALLTPQGKFLYDFFLIDDGQRLLLDARADGAARLLARLQLYRLRARVTLTDVSADLALAQLYGPGAHGMVGLTQAPGQARRWKGGLVFTDPRLGKLGVRALFPRAELQPVLRERGFALRSMQHWDRWRLALGVPLAGPDIHSDSSFALDADLDLLHAIDWDKGCYMGQEVTARSRYRGLVKKRLVPVSFAGHPPPPGTPVLAGAAQVGEMRSGFEGRGMALLRLDALKTPLTAAGIGLTPMIPNWLKPAL